jgi:hypothetical protein
MKRSKGAEEGSKKKAKPLQGEVEFPRGGGSSLAPIEYKVWLQITLRYSMPIILFLRVPWVVKYFCSISVVWGTFPPLIKGLLNPWAFDKSGLFDRPSSKKLRRIHPAFSPKHRDVVMRLQVLQV